MSIFVREVKIQNMYYVGNVNVKWVENPFDIGEKSPPVIGIVGTNGSGKSTILSRAIPWLIHPKSNVLSGELTEKVFFTDTPSLSVEIVFEHKGHIYEAKRTLTYYREREDWSDREELYRVGEDGKKENITRSWESIFGKDTGSSQPYVCEHHNLARISRKMASENGLRDFSDNLGHHELIQSLLRIKDEADGTITVAELSKLKGPKLKQYEELRTSIEAIEDEHETKCGELEEKEAICENNRLTYGEYDQFYKAYKDVESAQSELTTYESRQRNAIRSFIDNDILILSTLAKLKQHFSDEYSLDTTSLPSSDVSDLMVKTANDFKRLYEDIYNNLSGDDQKILENAIESKKNLDLSGVIGADPTNMGAETSTLKSRVRDVTNAKTNLARKKRGAASGTDIDTAVLDTWTRAREDILTLNGEIKKLNTQITGFKKTKEKLANHDASDAKVATAKNQLKIITRIQGILTNSVLSFEKSMQKSMLKASEEILNFIYKTETWSITQRNGTILPNKDGVELDLSLISEMGGPSSGQARTIALCIMIERYLATRCNIPLFLDDAYKDISEESDIDALLRSSAEEATLVRAVKEGRQVIWANISVPLTSGGTFARMTTRSIAESDTSKMSAPWDGTPLIGSPFSVGGI